MSIEIWPPLVRGEHERHDKALDACLGRCYRKLISIHFGINLHQDKRLDAACGFTARGSGDPDDSTATIRRWGQGKRPSPKSIDKVRRATLGAVDLDAWAAYPVIELAKLGAPCTKERLQALLLARSLRVRRRLDLEADGRSGTWFEAPSRQELLRVRNLRSLDAFVALLALARRGELTEQAHDFVLPAMCAYDIWPRVVARTPALQWRWEELTACLHRAFWSRRYLDWHMPTSMERLCTNVHTVLASPQAIYSLCSGRLRTPEWELAQQWRLLGDEYVLARAQRAAEAGMKILGKLSARSRQQRSEQGASSNG